MPQKRFLTIFILILVNILLISACGPATAVSEPSAESIVEEENTEDDHAEDENTEEENTEDDHAEEENTEDDHAEDENAEDDHADEMDHDLIETPDEFASLSNPYQDDNEAIEVGAELFSTYCATCHGVAGEGDGPAAEALTPKPANLADGAMMGALSDGYLFWRVSEGGIQEPFNSSMPAWDGSLTEDQRWQLISYTRTLSDSEDDHMSDDN